MIGINGYIYVKLRRSLGSEVLMEVMTLIVDLKDVKLRSLVKNVPEFHRAICIPSTSGHRVVPS
jgi:hypothetical protein